MDSREKQGDLVQKLAEMLSRLPCDIDMNGNAHLSPNSLSVEILPGGLREWMSADMVESSTRPTHEFPFMYLGGNLGIPKKVLYQLYMAAILLFKASRSISELCWHSTSVILLANPAHQTALNARKRLVLSAFLEPAKELAFTEVLFRGSSECAKQSILWDYRRWLFKHLYSPCLSINDANSTFCHWTATADLQFLPEIPSPAIIEEFNVIRKACEDYPRNYHAWTHHRFIVDVINLQLATQSTSSGVYYGILVNEYMSLRHWIDHHISDYSAMYHLCGLGRLFRDLESRYPYLGRDTMSPVTLDISLAEHAFTLITSYPSHESLWMYLRGAIALLPEEKRLELINRMESLTSQSHYFKQFIAWAEYASIL